MITSALLPIVLASAFADPPVLARPYGNVMGDGLGLRIATEPQAGAVCAPGETRMRPEKTVRAESSSAFL